MPTYKIDDRGPDAPYGPNITIVADSADFLNAASAQAFASGVSDLLAEHTNQNAESTYVMVRHDEQFFQVWPPVE